MARMTLTEYLDRYRLLQEAVAQDERNFSLLEMSPYVAFFRRFGETDNPALAPYLLTRMNLERRLARRGRLCLRYAERLARAIGRIPSRALRQHAQLRYLYGMTHEEIARCDFISLRSEYRRARKTQKAMEQAMREVMPRPRRCPTGRFTCSRPLARRGDIPRQKAG